MKIERQKDGSNKIVFEDGKYYFVQKGIDPIDGLIDIGLIQKKTTDILNNPVLDEVYLMPESFMFALSRKLKNDVLINPKEISWYKSKITEYNHEIKKQELIREHCVNRINKKNCGKYIICYEDILPEFIWLLSQTDCPTNDRDETQKENRGRVTAITLTWFIYSLVDIRKIEARISELKGLCEYLKLIAPDEFIAYCVLADKMGFDTEFDTDIYYELFNQMKNNVEIL